MTKTHSTTKQSQNWFGYRRGENGCDNTFDILFLPTEEVVAFLPFWHEEAETRDEAERLLTALNDCYNRGGQLIPDALYTANRCSDLLTLQLCDPEDVKDSSSPDDVKSR